MELGKKLINMHFILSGRTSHPLPARQLDNHIFVILFCTFFFLLASACSPSLVIIQKSIKQVFTVRENKEENQHT